MVTSCAATRWSGGAPGGCNSGCSRHTAAPCTVAADASSSCEIRRKRAPAHRAAVRNGGTVEGLRQGLGSASQGVGSASQGDYSFIQGQNSRHELWARCNTMGSAKASWRRRSHMSETLSLDAKLVQRRNAKQTAKHFQSKL